MASYALNNSERALQDIHDQKMTIVRKGTREDFEEAGEIASELLTHPELTPPHTRSCSHCPELRPAMPERQLN